MSIFRKASFLAVSRAYKAIHALPSYAIEKFKGKYRIDVGEEKSAQTRYCSSDEQEQLLATMAGRHAGKSLQVFVYANSEGTQEEENQGNYVLSKFCTAVAKEVQERLERDEAEE